MDWRLSHRLHVLPPLGRLAQEAPGHALRLLVCTKHEIIPLLLIFLSFLALDSLIYLYIVLTLAQGNLARVRNGTGFEIVPRPVLPDIIGFRPVRYCWAHVDIGSTLLCPNIASRP